MKTETYPRNRKILPLSIFDKRLEAARRVQESVRVELANLIRVRGALHTPWRLGRGYEAQDEGERLISQSLDQKDMRLVNLGIAKLEEALSLFKKAYKNAHEAEHDKPRMRPF